jgi:hypothetical protein
MKIVIVSFLFIGCAGAPFSSADLSDAGALDETGGNSALLTLATGGDESAGGSSTGTGGQAPTGGSNAGTGGQASTGGSNAGTGGQAPIGGASQCIPQRSTVCTVDSTTVTISSQHDFIAIQCKDNTYWCKGSTCTLGAADDKAVLCVKGGCNYNFACVTTESCSTVVTTGNYTCSCGNTGNVACF